MGDNLIVSGTILPAHTDRAHSVTNLVIDTNGMMHYVTAHTIDSFQVGMPVRVNLKQQKQEYRHEQPLPWEQPLLQHRAMSYAGGYIRALGGNERWSTYNAISRLVAPGIALGTTHAGSLVLYRLDNMEVIRRLAPSLPEPALDLHLLPGRDPSAPQCVILGNVSGISIFDLVSGTFTLPNVHVTEKDTLRSIVPLADGAHIVAFHKESQLIVIRISGEPKVVSRLQLQVDQTTPFGVPLLAMPNPEFIAAVGYPKDKVTFFQVKHDADGKVSLSEFMTKHIGEEYGRAAVTADGKHLVALRQWKRDFGQVFVLPPRVYGSTKPPLMKISSASELRSVKVDNDGNASIRFLLPEEVSGLDFGAAATVSAIPNGFGLALSKITQVSLVGLPSLKTIGNDVFAECSLLESASLKQLPSLESIGDNMFVLTTSLKALELSDLPALKSIGIRFGGGSALKEFSLPSLPSLTSIGSLFLMDCRELVAFSAAGGCPQLKSLASGFGFQCPNVDQLDLQGFGAVTSVQGPSLFWQSEPSTLVNIPEALHGKTHGYKSDFILGRYYEDSQSYVTFGIDGSYSMESYCAGFNGSSGSESKGTFYAKGDTIHVFIANRSSYVDCGGTQEDRETVEEKKTLTIKSSMEVDYNGTIYSR